MVTGAPIGAITARAYKEPTDAPEADGIFAWTDTTLVVTMVEGGDAIGLGYTDSAGSVTGLVTASWPDAVGGRDAFDLPLSPPAYSQRRANDVAVGPLFLLVATTGTGSRCRANHAGKCWPSPSMG